MAEPEGLSSERTASGTRRFRSSRLHVASLLALALLCGPFMTACQSPRPLAVTGHLNTRPIEHRDNTNIVAVDMGLTGSPHGDIQVASQRADWTPDGRLKISVEFENRTREALRLQIQTAFKDANDNFLPDQTPWKTIVLPRNVTSLYEVTALSKEAEKAHVRVRRAVSE